VNLIDERSPTAALGHSLPIDPNGYVRFDQQRTRAELRNRRDGPIAVIPVSADVAWIHFIGAIRTCRNALLSPRSFRPTTAAQLAQRQRVQQD
jgi:hypothetical protein